MIPVSIPSYSKAQRIQMQKLSHFFTSELLPTTINHTQVDEQQSQAAGHNHTHDANIDPIYTGPTLIKEQPSKHMNATNYTASRQPNLFS
ncbi:unnamed protein product [Rotaria sp. Silwood2]|nr:unnamed protein product [Rotaria sp. Silwood2]CAF3333788.1 unnamed protein product [Rotaria sp. Silwood2]CAF3436998.1 unnamed protein product [Rotaria sp. Silwood2]CAF4471428.1 unnamed protein product [Rotaria sp. Silwood2]CAF4473505.1 unnamed protein product [Rotaria sp. Silwood2]